MSTKIEFRAAPVDSRETDPRNSGVSRITPSRDRDNRQSSARFGIGATRKRFHRFGSLGGAIIAGGLLLAFACLAPRPAQAQRQGGGSQTDTVGPGALSTDLDDARINHSGGFPTLSDKQKHALMQANFERSKKDAAELAALAKQLREELNKPEVPTLSLESMNRIERIEKLAKKIREEMKGF